MHRDRASAASAAEIQPFVVMDVLRAPTRSRRQARRVIHMEIGEPDFTARAAGGGGGRRALRDGRSAYTATLGLPRCARRLAAHYRDCFSEEYSIRPDRDHFRCLGRLAADARALYVESGRRNRWCPIRLSGLPPHGARFEGTRPRRSGFAPATDFQPTLDMVRRRGARRTRGLLLGSPSEPDRHSDLAGRSWRRSRASSHARRRADRRRDLPGPGRTAGQPTTALGLPGEVVVVNSFSKYFCMTGWRLGWVGAASEADAAGIRETGAAPVSSRAPTACAARRAGLFCAGQPEGLRRRGAREFQRRRDFFLPALERAGPEGAGAARRRRSTSTPRCPGDGKRFALICSSAKASRRRRASTSARTERSATCASPTRGTWRTSRRPPNAARFCARRSGRAGRQADAALRSCFEQLLQARALGEHLEGVAGVRLVEGAGVHLQRGLGLAEAAQVFAQDLRADLMLTCGSSSALSPPCPTSFSGWNFGITCIRPLAPMLLSATGL